jgi:hypothetical protein
MMLGYGVKAVSTNCRSVCEIAQAKMCNEKLGGRGVNWFDAACICCIFPTLRSRLSVTHYIGRSNALMSIKFE